MYVPGHAHYASPIVLWRARRLFCRRLDSGDSGMLFTPSFLAITSGGMLALAGCGTLCPTMYGMSLGLFAKNLGLLGGFISSLCYLAVSVTMAVAAYLRKPPKPRSVGSMWRSGPSWRAARHFASETPTRRPPVTRSRCLAIVVLLTAALARLALSEEASASSRDQARGPAPEAISGNPAAENILPGKGG